MMNEAVWELPEGWELLALGEVCAVNPRRPRLSRDDDVPTSFLPMAGVDEIQGVIADLQIQPYSKIRRGYTYFEEEDILFAKITPSMQNGKSAIARDLIDKLGFGSTEFHVLRPSRRVIPEWIHLFVRQKRFRDEAVQHFRGAVGQQRVPAEFLGGYPLPVPPLDEQRRIVARIKALFDRIAEARRLRVAAEEQIGRLAESAAEVCLEGLHIVEFHSIVESYKNGIYKKNHFYGRGLPSIRMFNIQEGKIIAEGAPLLHVTSDELEKYGLLPGDIVVNRVNSCELVGKPRLVGSDLGPCTFESKNIRLRLRAGVADPRFVVIALNSEIVRKQVQSVLKPAIGQATINQSDLDGLTIPLPTLSAQHHIVEHLNAVQARVVELKRLQATSAAELERLRGAVLARALRGEL